MATRYVEIGRGELEAWLDLLPAHPSIAGWAPVAGTAGVYAIQLTSGPAVILLGSTQTKRGTAKGRGQASVDIRLATPSGKTINRKATRQARFHRTEGWRGNWARGVLALATEYAARQPFYDRLIAEAEAEQTAPEAAQQVAEPPQQPVAYVVVLGGVPVVVESDRERAVEAARLLTRQPPRQVAVTDVRVRALVNAAQLDELRRCSRAWQRQHRWPPRQPAQPTQPQKGGSL